MQNPSDADLLLIVDDDWYLRKVYEDALQLEGYPVLTAASGHEALDILRTASVQPRLIISDILMPGMDGFQFLAAVRAQPQWRSIPFLFISGQEDSGIVHDPVAGVVGYLSKPFHVPALLAMIDQMLRKSG